MLKTKPPTTGKGIFVPLTCLMPFPVEALYPLGIILAVMTAGSYALHETQRWGNHGKVWKTRTAICRELEQRLHALA